MGSKLKWAGICLAVLFAAGALAALGMHGEYDERDLPANLRMTSRSEDGFHVHASVLFYPRRRIFFLCTGVFGNGLQSIEDEYADIPASGTDLVLKRKWPGLCQYEFYSIYATCTKSKIKPDDSQERYETASIGMLEKAGRGKAEYRHAAVSGNPLQESALGIVGAGTSKKFFGCDSGCEEQRTFGIDAQTPVVNITCYEGTEP